MSKSSILCLLLASLAVASYAQESQTFEVYAGFHSNETDQWHFLKFFPETLRVRVGDRVTWTSFGDHTVTFNPKSFELFNETISNVTVGEADGDTFRAYSDYLRPVGDNNLTSPREEASSGILGSNETYTLTFSASGTYNYVCMLHFPIMQGRIIVEDGNKTEDDDKEGGELLSPEEVDEEADEEIELLVERTLPDLDVVKVVDTDLPPRRPNGTATIWTIRIVGDFISKASRDDFIPQTISVSVGDTVEFVNDDIDLHTVSFNSSGVFEEELIFDPDLNKFLFREIYLTETGDPDDYSGGFLSCGILYPLNVIYSTSGNESTNVTSIKRWCRITFTAPGTYPYRCDFHYDEGMVGVITVLPPAVSTATATATETAASTETGIGTETETATGTETESATAAGTATGIGTETGAETSA